MYGLIVLTSISVMILADSGLEEAGLRIGWSNCGRANAGPREVRI
jgi:hypothetical protein